VLAAAAAKDRMAGKFNRGSSLRNQLERSAQPLMF
jgi:hypothetical protein